MNANKIVKKYISRPIWGPLAGLAMSIAAIFMIEYGDAIWGEFLLVIGALMMLVSAIQTLIPRAAANRSVKRLQKIGQLEKAAAELINEEPQLFCKNKIALTSSFLFGKRMGAACAYNDILWLYKKRYTQRFLFIPIYVQDSLEVETGKQSVHINLGKKDKKNELTQIIRVIYEKNPNILVGHTQENQKAYNELRKQKKQKERGNA